MASNQASFWVKKRMIIPYVAQTGFGTKHDVEYEQLADETYSSRQL